MYSLSVYSQDYYWFNGNRIKLEIYSTKINVTTTIELDFSSSLKEFGATEVKQIERSKNNTFLFSVDLSSSKVYNDIVNYLKSSERVVSVSPYFQRGENVNSIGTSSFFYVRLHKEDDYKLLVDFASQNALQIIEQIPFMEEWFILSTTNPKVNSVEMSNLVYESGLFADVDPAFMFNFNPNCTNDPMFNQL